MQAFVVLFGVWLMFVGLTVSKLIPSLPVNWDVVGGTFMVIIGASVINGSLNSDSKVKKSKK